ncbi:MAG: hypothetical protein PHO26_04315 [Dehalococcoidia bacterium]|nr:hypothetical protein [Dehalococcoidia bacterium]
MDMTLGPREAEQVLKDSFKIYGRDFPTLLAIISATGLPLVVLGWAWLAASMFVLWPYMIPLEQSQLLTPYLFAGGILLLALAIVVIPLLIGALIYAVAGQCAGQKVGFGQAYRFAWKRIGSLIGTGIILYATVIWLPYTLIGIPVAVYFGVTCAFALQAALMEDCGVSAALSRSQELVKNNWLRVLSYLLLLGLVTGAMIVLLSVTLILPVFVVPICVAGTTLIYFDLRVRKEGYTVEVLRKELGLEQGPKGPINVT